MPIDERVRVQTEARGALAFQRDMRANAASIRGLGTAGRESGRHLTYLGQRGFWLNQIFFTMRRTIYGLTLALGAAAGAAIKMGFQFNMTMENNTLAFTRFLGSAQAAKNELNFLYNLAAKTPFEFGDVVQATRQFLAFGFSLKDANKTLAALADAVAGFGLGPDAIARAQLALGQMRSSGRILGQDIRQLEQLGLFNPEDFAKRLRIPVNRLGNIGTLGIPSKQGIDAIVAYWRSRFGGAAVAFQRTMQGQISSLHDYAAQLFGQMTQPLYDKLRKQVFPEISRIVNAGRVGFAQGGWDEMFKAMDKASGGSYDLYNRWVLLKGAATDLKNVLEPLIGDFMWAYRTLRPLYGLMFVGLSKGATMLGFSLGKLKWIIRPLIALLIIERSAMLGVAIAEKSLAIWTAVAAFVTGRYTMLKKAKIFWEKVDVFWLKKEAFATEEVWVAEEGRYRTQLASTGIMGKAARGMWGMVVALQTGAVAAWEFTAALLANPITWIVIGVAALVAGLIVLYFKWKPFHDLVVDTFEFIKRHWVVVSIALSNMFAPLIPFVVITITLIRNFRTLVGLAHDLKKAWDWHPNFGPKWLWKDISWNDVKHAATDLPFAGFNAGHVTGSHPSPKVAVSSPRPSAPGGQIAMPYGTNHMRIEVPLHLDRQVLARAIADVMVDQNARQGG